MVEFFSATAHVFLFLILYFEVFLLVTFFEQRGKKSRVPAVPHRYPRVAIFVPCFNEARTVEKTVESLLALEYPKEKLSILIIDDGSTDTTWEVIQRFATHPQVRLLQKENGGKHTALNLALTQTDADLVGCLDADSYVAPDALQKMVTRFEDTTIMAMTPNIQVYEPKNLLQMIQKAEYNLSVFFRKSFATLGSTYITPGPFSIFRREVFAVIGPYRKAHHTEDMEIAMRMQSYGMQIGNAEDVLVYTSTPKSVRALMHQRLRWVYGFLNNTLDYRHILLNPRYGNLGLFILPMAVLSVFSALYLTAFLIVTSAQSLGRTATEISVVGLPTFSFSPSFDFFFFNTQSLAILGIVSVTLTLVLMLSGKYLTIRRISLSRDILYFFLFYGFLAPIWLARALYNTAFSRSITWR